MGTLGFVELQRPGQGVQNGFGDAGEMPTFDAGVVPGADTGEHRDLFATQPFDRPVSGPSSTAEGLVQLAH